MRSDEVRGERAMGTTDQWLNDVEAEPIHCEAADWLLRLQSPRVSMQLRDEFLGWIESDPGNVSAFVELAWTSYRTWAANSHLADMQKHIEHLYPLATQNAVRAKAPMRRTLYAMAASIAVAISLCAALVHYGAELVKVVASPEARTAKFETSIGQNRAVTLDDSSRLTLGGRTRVEVAISRKERTVTLHQGEAYFEVAKEARKFTVHAGTVNVTALGTAFNINSTGDRTVVTVTEGRVVVTPHLQGTGRVGEHGLYLSAGEQTTASQDSLGAVISVPDWQAVISWPTGRLSFRKRPLRDAVGDVNRYSHKPLVLAPELGDITVTGTLTINNIEVWVKSLEKAFGVTASEESDRIVIRPNAKR